MTVGNQYKNAVVQTKADDKKYGREQDVRTLDLIRKCRHLLKKKKKPKRSTKTGAAHSGKSDANGLLCEQALLHCQTAKHMFYQVSLKMSATDQNQVRNSM